MNEFLFVFRKHTAAIAVQVSANNLQAIAKSWQNWMGSLAAQNKLVSSGRQLASETNLIKPDRGVERNEVITGYIIIKAEDLNEAEMLASGCPILALGGSVEICAVMSMDSSLFP
jgi:hypothetical protein